MALVDSLLTAIVRADGDALVMHVGERPIVVSGPKTIDLSTHGMSLGAMVGMLGQLLPPEALASLQEFGAVEHALPSPTNDNFSVVAARSGDDIWIEIRRRREAPDVSETAAAVEPVHEVSATIGVGATDNPIEPLAMPELAAGPATMAPLQAAARQEISPEGDEAALREPIPERAREAVLLEANSEPAGGEVAAPESASGPAGEEADLPEPVSEPVDAHVAEPVASASEAVSSDSTDVTDADQTPAAPLMTEGEQLERAASSASVAAIPDSRSRVHTAAMPVMASAGGSTHPVSTVAAIAPMDPARHPDPLGGGPPPNPVSASEPPATALPGGGLDNGVSPPEAPVTRTVRIEVPARVASSRANGIDRLLRVADSAGASELFLISQARPYVRVGGNVRPLEEEAQLVASDIEAMIDDVTPEPWRDAVRRGDPAEWLIELSDVGRVKCSTFRNHRGPGANFHFAFLRTATADELQLSAEMRLLATEPDGLILVAGEAGNDRSAMVAAFVDIVNHQRADYIITIEPQVRAVHVNQQALVSQREVGHDPARVAAATRAALREQPDVLVIEGLATSEMAHLAIEASSQDRLVIVSIEAASAAAAVQRLIELVPTEHRQAARDILSRRFRGAVAQLLLRKKAGGRIAAREVMSGSRAVARLLVEGDVEHLAAHLESGIPGMSLLADSIAEFVRSGVVDVREAARKAPDAQGLLARLEAAGVDLSALGG